MIDPAIFFNRLRQGGIDFFTGVPDSLLKHFCAYLEDHCSESEHVIAANEGNAVALAAGYHLSTGKLACVYMQNSGLGNAINPLMSLTDPEVYSIPLLLVIGWRGEPGLKDEPQNVKQGRITAGLLDTMEIPYSVIDSDSHCNQVIDSLLDKIKNTNGPAALLVRKNTFAPYTKIGSREPLSTLSRETALTEILTLAGENTLVVSTTGKTFREVFEIRARLGQPQRDFLTVGSMGHTASIALGVALGNPQKRVICIDGDGSALMHMGSLPVIGELKPANLVYILLNNAAHESVGGHPTAALRFDFSAMANACGFRKYRLADTTTHLKDCRAELRQSPGPHMIEVRIRTGSRDVSAALPAPRRKTKKPSWRQQLTEASRNKTAGDIWTDYNPVRITSGPGAIDRLFSLDPPIAAGKRIFMVTSAGFSTRGVVEQIEAKARKKGLERPILVFDGVTPNPELDLLDRIATGLRSEGITGIIALGGGSVLDTAKAISVALPSDMEAPLALVLRQGRPHQWKSRIPVVVIPTTAGTGAEVTPFATVWDSENNKKYSVSGEMVYPVHALLDPELTLTLPPKETLYTGIDAISHALESLWNKNRTPVSEGLALKALSLANEALPSVLNQPGSLYFREMMQQAALLAGLAISPRTAIAHAISYPLTMRFGVPHGLACSFTLLKIIEHYAPYDKDGAVKHSLFETLPILEGLKIISTPQTAVASSTACGVAV